MSEKSGKKNAADLQFQNWLFFLIKHADNLFFSYLFQSSSALWMKMTKTAACF